MFAGSGVNASHVNLKNKSMNVNSTSSVSTGRAASFRDLSTNNIEYVVAKFIAVLHNARSHDNDFHVLVFLM